MMDSSTFILTAIIKAEIISIRSPTSLDQSRRDILRPQVTFDRLNGQILHIVFLTTSRNFQPPDAASSQASTPSPQASAGWAQDVGGPGGAASQSTSGGSSTPAGLSAVDKLAATAQAGALAPLAGASPLTGMRNTHFRNTASSSQRGRAALLKPISAVMLCAFRAT